MRRSPSFLFRSTSFCYSNGIATHARSPIVQIENATFYRHHPTSAPSFGGTATANAPLFPGLTFSLPSFASEPQHWSILGASGAGKTTFLEVLRGQHICLPPDARSYPYLSSDEIAAKDHRLRFPGRALKYVGFGGERGGLGGSGTRGAYLSARYESRREETDFSLLDYLKGHTELNPSEEHEGSDKVDAMLAGVIKDLKLGELLDMPVGNLSNGQTRRAQIAKALLGQPEVLLLDEPFMGLDPPTLRTLSTLLHRLALANAPRLVLSLRVQDPLPDWITHIIYLNQDCTVAVQGRKEEVLTELRRHFAPAKKPSAADDARSSIYSTVEIGRTLVSDDIGIDPAYRSSNATSTGLDETQEGSFILGEPPSRNTVTHDEVNKKPYYARLGLRPYGKQALELAEGDLIREPLVKMEGVCVKYGKKKALGGWKKRVNREIVQGLWWTVRRGDRWGVFGPNGSGKTTLLSLICSDHPQTYSLPIELFGQSRLPKPGQPGISIFDLQARIGHSSPEIHAFFPRNLTVRQTLENAWADTFLGKAQLNHQRDRDVDAHLRWFHAELNPGASLLTEKDATTAQDPVKSRRAPDLASVPSHRASHQIERIEAVDLDWADELRFGDISFSAQRVALFLRAIIKRPDLVILDEAFSGMDAYVRDRCMLWLDHGQQQIWSYVVEDGTPRKRKRNLLTKVGRMGGARFSGLSQEQALICVSHVKEEVPNSVRQWMCLPDPDTRAAVRCGRLVTPLSGNWKRWDRIWGM